MPKFNWQNGTLVSKAKVEIDGKIYEVEPEQYSGQTPLSAENFNAMQDGIYDDIGEVNSLDTNSRDSLVDAINEPLMRVLWENNNVSNMTSGAPINLSSSDYDMLLWVFALSVSNSQNHSISACVKGKNCILDTRTGDSNIYVYRLLTYVDDTTYKVGNGYQNAGVNDGNAIPLMAIGIKLY